MMQTRRSTVQTFSGLEKKNDHLSLREWLGEPWQGLSHCRQPDQGEYGEQQRDFLPFCKTEKLAEEMPKVSQSWQVHAQAQP